MHSKGYAQKPKSVPTQPPPDPTMTLPGTSSVLRTFFPIVLLVFTVVVVGAQEIQVLPEPTALAQQSLRPYWHVFVAYAIVIALIGGWAVSIARRLRAVEDRLVD